MDQRFLTEKPVAEVAEARYARSMWYLLLGCPPASPSLVDSQPGTSDTADTDTGDTDTDTADTDSGTHASGLTLTTDSEMVLMLRASWTDSAPAEEWLEYRWEGEDWLVAPVTGPGTAVLLGIPEETDVEARLVEQPDGVPRYSEVVAGRTGSLPNGVLAPRIDAYDPALADVAPYGMIGIAGGDYTYSPPYWIEIFDRTGRVVWYQKVPDDMMMFYPTVAFDGTHIWFEAEDIFGIGNATPSVTRTTLDRRWSTSIEVPDMGQAIAEGPDGSFFYEQRSRSLQSLSRVDPDGTRTVVWNCAQWMRDHGLPTSDCHMNTSNWSATHNTVLASMFTSDTVFEIDVATGEPIRQMGQLTEGDPYTFSPETAIFDYQHGPYWTDAGTLLVSTHVRGHSGVQVAAEYTVDDATKTLTRVWSYTSTDMWATQVGEAIRLRNGNTVQGYGQDGGVREVTPDGETAWQATWEKDQQGYRVVGHFSLIDDLYALNRGPQ